MYATNNHKITKVKVHKGAMLKEHAEVTYAIMKSYVNKINLKKKYKLPSIIYSGFKSSSFSDDKLSNIT